MATPITTEYLLSFPALHKIPETRLREVVDKLHSHWINTIDDLVSVTQKGLLNADIPLLVATALKPEEGMWYKVSGSLSRPTSHAGARYKLFKLASPDGLYPEGMNASTAFECTESDSAGRSIIKFSVVFKTLKPAKLFLEELNGYIHRSSGALQLIDHQGTSRAPEVAEVSPFRTTIHTMVSKDDYGIPTQGEQDVEESSPPLDLVWETRSSDVSVDVTLLSLNDPVCVFQRLENDAYFQLAKPESAHIFPSVKCVGDFKWLDKADYNRLALSRDVHLNFDGTARGRGRVKKRKTAQTFAIRPVRPDAGYSVCEFKGTSCYRIPVELVLNVNEIGDALLRNLGNNATLHKPADSRWTINGTDVHIFYPQNRRVRLMTETADDGSPVLIKAIPGVTELQACWSNSESDLYTLEAAEVLEKCLLWNYANALENWAVTG